MTSRVVIRPELQSFAEYQPGPTPETLAARLGVPVTRILKLDANENPYGAPPAVGEALARLDASRYPDAAALALRAALAAYSGQPLDCIVCGNGSDELLELLCRLLVAPGETVVTAEPTFGMYAVAARQHGARVLDVPRQPDTFALNTPALLAAAAGARLLFLCAPNNPTGTPLPEADLRAILDAAPCAVVVDEAYAEFAGTSALPLLDAYPQLIVLRTLSKYAGLAGLRLGYALLDPQLAVALRRVKAPYNVNLAAQVAGVAALSDAAWLADKQGRVIAGRERLAAGLAALPGLHVYPSAANFVLVRWLDAAAAAAVYAGLLERGILIRRYGHAPLQGCLRISVGTEEQNAIVLEEVCRLCPKP